MVSISDDEDSNLPESIEKDKYYNLKAGIFLTSVAGVAAVGAFGAALISAKKQDPDYFNKGILHTRDLPDNGVQLALKALKWGTVYAVAGVGLFCISVWGLSGAKNMQEFRQSMGSLLPRIPKNNPPQGRTEFAGLTDLLTYLSTDYSNKKSTDQ
uniref:Transmembrane protein 242 n=1 Tax=Clastoptera arizonana TaxID=38151 RepID=A0A1B6CLV8_9HEMI